MNDSPKQRLTYIDWMRGFACLMMFQTHCYDSWLGGAAREGKLHQMSQLGGTLPAPLFLFLAGISFALITDRLRAKNAPRDQIARQTILRGAEILGLGLLFRVQEFILGQPSAPWTDLLRVDILNIIGVSIMLMGVVSWLVGAREREYGSGEIEDAQYLGGGGGGAGDFDGDASSLDHLAAAVAALVPRIVYQRRAHLRQAATLAFSDISVGGVCICGVGGGIFAADAESPEA